MSLLGDRWTLVVLRDAFLGRPPLRRLPGEPRHLALATGRQAGPLVEAGILRKEPYRDAIRTREQYRLTEKGLDLYPVITALRTWADKHDAPAGGPLVLYRHRDCGGLTELVHSCSKCGEELSARDVRPEPGPGLKRALAGSAA